MLTDLGKACSGLSSRIGELGACRGTCTWQQRNRSRLFNSQLVMLILCVEVNNSKLNVFFNMTYSDNYCVNLSPDKDFN